MPSGEGRQAGVGFEPAGQVGGPYAPHAPLYWLAPLHILCNVDSTVHPIAIPFVSLTLMSLWGLE